MINTNLSTLHRAKVGAAYKAPGMGGYMTVVYQHKGETATKGVASVDDGATVIAFQPRTSATGAWYFILPGSGSGLVAGPYAISGGLGAVMAKTLRGDSDFTFTASSSDLRLTGELLGFLLTDQAWQTLTFQDCETNRTGSGIW